MELSPSINKSMALLKRDAVVLDYGAGRSAAHIDDACDYRRSLLNLRSKVSRVIGVDVDEAVKQNPALDEAYVINVNNSLPLGDASIDENRF
jgi:hypothetical protein